ncbi:MULTISPECIES: spore cortex biosynthesis protein YabQ [Bacillus]|uniref:Spore coat protein n=2 Tax=Bacillus TaxID=1386 RepID=A0A0M4FM30_9BACI|nr:MULTISPECIES: spore cortex biosynthesis protein YabQ [Bacillus]ALC83279.1 spore coat protein [Bacillus gobiensis]MBP1084163.1 spore cortex biosynthesis protein YabQ [Bacillus capparidis]MED1098167.1 spore cortex biosynthesis protein YabQ [Bacillus capparidis]
MTLSVQFYTMLSMAGMGLWLGASLDTYRIFVIRSKTANWLLIFHDLLFWAIQGFLFFYVLLLINKGELRIYIFLAVLLGFATYQSLFKRMYVTTIRWCIRLVNSIFQFLLKTVRILLIKPVFGIIQFAIAVLLFLIYRILDVLKFIFIFLYKIISFLLFPFFFLFKKLLPKRFQEIIKRFFIKSAGIMEKGKKLLLSMKKDKK